jgi:hypothetical protein
LFFSLTFSGQIYFNFALISKTYLLTIGSLLLKAQSKMKLKFVTLLLTFCVYGKVSFFTFPKFIYSLLN